MLTSYEIHKKGTRILICKVDESYSKYDSGYAVSSERIPIEDFSSKLISLLTLEGCPLAELNGNTINCVAYGFICKNGIIKDYDTNNIKITFDEEFLNDKELVKKVQSIVDKYGNPMNYNFEFNGKQIGVSKLIESLDKKRSAKNITLYLLQNYLIRGTIDTINLKDLSIIYSFLKEYGEDFLRETSYDSKTPFGIWYKLLKENKLPLFLVLLLAICFCFFPSLDFLIFLLLPINAYLLVKNHIDELLKKSLDKKTLEQILSNIEEKRPEIKKQYLLENDIFLYFISTIENHLESNRVLFEKELNELSSLKNEYMRVFFVDNTIDFTNYIQRTVSILVSSSEKEKKENITNSWVILQKSIKLLEEIYGKSFLKDRMLQFILDDISVVDEKAYESSKVDRSSLFDLAFDRIRFLCSETTDKDIQKSLSFRLKQIEENINNTTAEEQISVQGLDLVQEKGRVQEEKVKQMTIKPVDTK